MDLRVVAEELVNLQFNHAESEGTGFNKSDQIEVLYKALTEYFPEAVGFPGEQVARKDLENVKIDSLTCLKYVLAGKNRELTRSFTWTSAGLDSIKSDEYWRERYKGTTQLTTADMKWLKALYDHHTK